MLNIITQNWTIAVPVIAVLVIFLIYKLNSKSNRSIVQTEVKLVEKTRVSHDTFLFTFLLPQQNQTLGLKIGEHVETM